MNEKSIEEKFSNTIDDYLDGIKPTDMSRPSEYDDIFQLGMSLTDRDFSKDSNKEIVFHKIMNNISKGEDNMRKSNIRKRFAVTAAAVCIICGVLVQTPSAQEFVFKIIKTISLDHIVVHQTEQDMKEAYPVPDRLKRKIFDKEGNPIEEFRKDYNGKYYTADGEEIAEISPESGEIITAKEKEEMIKDTILTVKNFDELNSYTCFDVILPSYLPEGYEFDRAEIYKGENGIVKNSKYIDLYFINKDTNGYIFMQQRFADEETAYETATDGKIEEIQINGINAIVMDGNSVDWEANGVLYGLHGRKEITTEDLIKIAESIQK